MRRQSRLAATFLLAALAAFVPACNKRSPAPVVNRRAGDPELAVATAEARRRWPEFVAAFNEHKAGRVCVVKYAAPTKDGSAEHIWLRVTEVNASSVTGRLDNEPRSDIGHKFGDLVTIKPDEIEDWVYTDAGKMTGGFTIAVLQKAAAKGTKR